MTVTAPPPTATAASLSGNGSHAADRSFRYLALGAGLTVLIILGLVITFTTKEAWPAFTAPGSDFFTSTRWAPNEGIFGSLTLVYGTAVVSLIALVFAVPTSVGIALFLTEVAPVRLRRPISLIIDLLAAVPSVVFGLWGFIYLRGGLTDFYRDLAGALDGIPILGSIFSTPVSGSSFFTAGLILALMITPIITSLTREVLDTVPMAQREASLALGATRWETIRNAVLPYGKGGIVGAVMLGLGRAMGETIAVALVIGGGFQITANVLTSGNAMPAVIANQFGEASGTYRSALIGLGVALFVLTVLVNLVARWIISRSNKALGKVAL